MSIFLHYDRASIHTRLLHRGYYLPRYECHKNNCNLGMFVARMIGVK